MFASFLIFSWYLYNDPGALPGRALDLYRAVNTADPLTDGTQAQPVAL
jgi:hypothetical protein